MFLIRIGVVYFPNQLIPFLVMENDYSFQIVLNIFECHAAFNTYSTITPEHATKLTCWVAENDLLSILEGDSIGSIVLHDQTIAAYLGIELVISMKAI